MEREGRTICYFPLIFCAEMVKTMEREILLKVTQTHFIV